MTESSRRARSAPLHTLAMALGLVISPASHADDHGSRARVPLLPLYQQECAACHLAYPPGLLPAASWQRLMSGLPRHFGSDASLDEATVKQLSVWLTSHAAPAARVSAPPDDRITRSTWFVREHDEVSAATWKLPSVKSKANCAACHTRADQGDFSEHNIRIPR